MKPYFTTRDDTLPPEQKTNTSLTSKPRNLTAHHISNKKKNGPAASPTHVFQPEIQWYNGVYGTQHLTSSFEAYQLNTATTSFHVQKTNPHG